MGSMPAPSALSTLFHQMHQPTSSQLPFRPLGRTGASVSAVGLGTVKFGRNTAVKYPTPYDLPSDESVAELLRVARDMGVRLVDTAPAYGSSEERLGEFLPRIAPRSFWFLSSKVGEEFDGMTSRFDFSREHAFYSIDRSLTRLRTEYLDLLLLHLSDEDVRDLHLAADAGWLDEVRESGRVRLLGASIKTVESAMLAMNLGLQVLMITFNRADQRMLPVIRLAAARGVGVLIKKGLAGGHDTHATLNGAGPESAVRFVLAEHAVSSLVVGTINPGHLRRLVAAASTPG